ncbi:hypothetical protein Z949_3723 [Sulfitobacter guttiformis KCTC 32187]|nr:hypothetical protein Z949_3723 [Sulfitobacter guttiformis KCTC 32187]
MRHGNSPEMALPPYPCCGEKVPALRTCMKSRFIYVEIVVT